MKFEQKITDRRILLAIRRMGPTRMSHLADRLGVTRQAMWYRLKRLERRKKVSRTKGDRSVRQHDVWRIPGTTWE